MDRRPVATRIGSISAIGGAVLLAAGTYMHPLGTDPNDALSAFAEYAADDLWIVSHLTQFLGVALMMSAFALLSQRMEDGPAAEWAHLGMAAAIGTLALSAVLQAVDGVALKVLVNAWAAGTESEKPARFQTAFAVRQVEIGLASYASMLSGITAVVYSIALVVDGRFPKWLGALGIAGALALIVAGVAMAYTGFSELAMAINMPSSILLLIWMISLGAVMWPRSKSGRSAQ